MSRLMLFILFFEFLNVFVCLCSIDYTIQASLRAHVVGQWTRVSNHIQLPLYNARKICSGRSYSAFDYIFCGVLLDEEVFVNTEFIYTCLMWRSSCAYFSWSQIGNISKYCVKKNRC